MWTKCSTAACSVHCHGPAPPKKLELPASPCPELLVTNSVPSDFQTNEIRKLILSVEAEISDLDAEIINVQRALGRLKLKRTGLAEFVKSHRGVVSTIRRLPSELLAGIFSYSLAAGEPFHSPDALSHVVGVCNRWRTIVLAFPLLWRHISLTIYESPSQESGKLKQISLQLQRSAPAALSIGLDADTRQTCPFSVRLLDILLTESRRWKSLYLRIHPPHHKHFTGAEFPILEKLSLVAYEPLTEDTALFLESFPALVDLTLQVNTRDAASLPGTLDFVWAQLRTCTLSGCSLTDVKHILPLFSNGTRVQVEVFSRLGGELGNVPLASVHTAVSDLSLVLPHCRWRGIDTLLRALVAPCLKRFYIDAQYSEQALTAFFDQSSCVLTHLGLGHGSFERDRPLADDLPLLLASPHARDIVELKISLRHGEIPEEVLGALATRDIAPNLRTLVFRHGKLDEAVVSLLKLHANRRPIFQCLRLGSYWHSVSISRDSVQVLKSGGMEVVTFTV